MTIKDYKELLNTYDENLDMIFANNEASCEYDAECGSFHVHTDLDNNPVQLIFTIDGEY